MEPHTRLVQMRRKCGLTQQEVAEYIGISRNTLASYESGKTPLPATMFIRLSQLYKCDVFDIYHVHTDNLIYDVPKSELFLAHAEYRVGEIRKIDIEMGIEMPDEYYDKKIKEMCEDLVRYAKGV